jgi:hypothetical protein
LVWPIARDGHRACQKGDEGDQLRCQQDLEVRETELVTALRGEQARWTDFNNRLDELERSLSEHRQDR